MMPKNIGRFGVISDNTKMVELQPPLDKIVKSGLCKLRISNYYFDEPIFDEYELTTVRATWDFAAAESIVQSRDSILDLGCGDGRLLLHLASKFELQDSVGIDVSPIAVNRFETGITFERRSQMCARVGDIFNLPDDITKRKFDVILLGDATINFILEDSALEQLFRSASRLVRSKGSKILVAVFGDGTPEKLSFMDKRCTVVPFRREDGRVALIWWAYKYDAEKLIMHRSAFANTGWDADGNIEGVISDLRDRMWTPSSIMPIAKNCGLEIDRIMKSAVQDGTAIGMETAVVIFKRAD